MCWQADAHLRLYMLINVLSFVKTDKTLEDMGRVGGNVASVLAFYSDDLSSNPADAYSFFAYNCVWKERNKQKEAVVGPLYTLATLQSIKM